MKKNLGSTGRLIFSGQCCSIWPKPACCAKTPTGSSRPMRCERGKTIWTFATRSLTNRDHETAEPGKAREKTFDYTRQLGNVDAIFKRVLNE